MIKRLRDEITGQYAIKNADWSARRRTTTRSATRRGVRGDAIEQKKNKSSTANPLRPWKKSCSIIHKRSLTLNLFVLRRG